MRGERVVGLELGAMRLEDAGRPTVRTAAHVFVEPSRVNAERVRRALASFDFGALAP